jgi:DNA-binding MarR family transcriptional regulator
MRAFVVLADSGSLQRAAERLFLTPSAVTRQIQRLEAVLKTPLLDRRVKPARITREGRAVLERGRQMVRMMEELKANGAPGKYGVANRGLCLLIAYMTEFFNTGTASGVPNSSPRSVDKWRQKSVARSRSIVLRTTTSPSYSRT